MAKEQKTEQRKDDRKYEDTDEGPLADPTIVMALTILMVMEKHPAYGKKTKDAYSK